MKRILACITALMLLLPPAWAENAVYDDYSAQYEAILQREEAIGLEIQIVQLQIQLAQHNNDAEALSAYQTQEAALQAELELLAGQKHRLAARYVPAIFQEQTRLQQEAEELQQQMTVLEAALVANAADQAALSDLYSTCIRMAGLTATIKGFLSDVTVYALLDEQGVITGMLVDAPWETPGLGACCKDPAFINQFVGQTGPFILGVNVDAVACATVTSQAVVDAVNSFYPTYTHTVSAKGLLSDVYVTVTLDADGSIAMLTVDASGETAGIATPCTEEAFLSQFVGRKGPFTDVDAVAGATFTSNAVITAVNSMFTAEEGDERK